MSRRSACVRAFGRSSPVIPPPFSVSSCIGIKSRFSIILRWTILALRMTRHPSIIEVVMHRFALFALFAATAFAQANDPFKAKPPADVDAALRARVLEFFDLHVKGEFRKAEALVAEDTKDF